MLFLDRRGDKVEGDQGVKTYMGSQSTALEREQKQFNWMDWEGLFNRENVARVDQKECHNRRATVRQLKSVAEEVTN